ncbi:hypothetical protein [Streptomyces sp. NPDC001401]|uniref:hypothetical protein n=1 Tax=Streptomyces sp. NPDC001401 TaxID=3364570 RepID=UPI003689D42B
MDQGVMGPHPLGSAAGRQHGEGQPGLAVGGLTLRRRNSGAQAVAVRRDALLDGLAEVLEQMKPVRNLQRVGGTESRAF